MKLMKKHLAKLDMPAKKAKPMMDEKEIEIELGDMEDEEEEMPEEEISLEEMQPEEPENEELAKLSDQELLAEIKKRGLMGELQKEEPEMEMEG